MDSLYQNTNDISFPSSSISVRRTGLKLKSMIAAAGYDVVDVQKALGLACPQSIYRWFSGIALPTVDHLFVISRMLGVRVDDLLVQEYKVDKNLSPGYKYLNIYRDAFIQKMKHIKD